MRLARKRRLIFSGGTRWNPCLLEVEIDTFTNVYPKIAFGHPLTQMEPHAEPLVMKPGTRSDTPL